MGKWQYYIKAFGVWDSAMYPGDIYILIQDAYRNEGYAMDLLLWCEDSQVCDRYEDANIIIRRIA